MALIPGPTGVGDPLPDFKGHRLVLASSSARRKTLLELLGIPFEVRVKSVDERFPEGLKREAIPLYLAALKSSALQPDHKEIVLTADTIVWHRGSALGKPKDKTEAVQMLESLSGDQHEVITAVVIKSSTQTRAFYDSATVHFKALEPAEIQFYLSAYQPLDKAGAYGIQDWIGGIGIEKINGSFYTVMGLPLQKLYAHLKSFFKR